MFLGGNDGRCVGMTNLLLHVPIVLKSGSLNLLEHSGPVQACNGIALPLAILFLRKAFCFVIKLKDNKQTNKQTNSVRIQTKTCM